MLQSLLHLSPSPDDAGRRPSSHFYRMVWVGRDRYRLHLSIPLSRSMALPHYPAAAQLLHRKGPSSHRQSATSPPLYSPCLVRGLLRGLLLYRAASVSFRPLHTLFVHPICRKTQLLPCPPSPTAGCWICLQPAGNGWGLAPLVLHAGAV